MDFSKSEILAAAAFLVATSGSMIKLLLSWVKKDKEDLDQCRKDKEEILKQVRELDGKYNYLKGKMEGVETLSISLIEKLDDLNK